MRKLSYGLGATALLSFGACADQGNTVDPLDFGANGTGIEFTIAPLDLPGVSDACYSFEVVNGGGDRVVARGSATGSAAAGQGGDGGPIGLSAPLSNPLCGSQFGFGGEISYVAPCDASEGNQLHDVTLWVNAVCQGGTTGVGCAPFNGFVNPCGSAGCTVQATCVENADVPVTFNFTVMASAQQGFFDIAVNFDNVFCSAKLDTCYEDGSQINLLFPAGGTTRARTAVAAVACTTGESTDDGPNTYLHFTTLQVTCGTDTFNWTPTPTTQEGNLTLTASGGATLDAAVYFGTEGLPNMNKVYTNFAFVTPATDCTVGWTVVPSSSVTGPVAANGANGVYTQVSGVDFNAVAVPADGCVRNQLNSNPNAQSNPLQSQVVTEYFETTPNYTSKLAQDATAFAAP